MVAARVVLCFPCSYFRFCLRGRLPDKSFRSAIVTRPTSWHPGASCFEAYSRKLMPGNGVSPTPLFRGVSETRGARVRDFRRGAREYGCGTRSRGTSRLCSATVSFSGRPDFPQLWPDLPARMLATSRKTNNN